uniref:tRNA pseudouridine synthase n=1 Tax=Solanum tuberosum TaxID=4113 RepID=M1D2V4_SOLTU
MGWSPIPVGFSARFSCLSRVYKYFFWQGNLNITAMQTAAEKFLGEHDFRNFCKMDADNVHNYRRHIISFEILPFNERFSSISLTLCFFYLFSTCRERINKLTSVIFLKFYDALTYFLS